jgi:hypothetical protein
MILVYLLQSLFCSQFESVDISVPPNAGNNLPANSKRSAAVGRSG